MGADSSANAVGLYRLCLSATTGLAGAPTLHLSLLVDAPSGRVTGQGSVTQALAPPYGNVPISNITGQIHGAGIPPVTKLMGLKGEAFISFPPPAIGSYLEPFTATFAVDNNWTGQAGWTLGNKKAENVPVKSVPC
jgi:hypothetical protein